MKLVELARTLGLQIGGVPDPDREIDAVAPIEGAGPGQLTFIAEPRYAPLLRSTGAAAVVCTASLAEGASLPCLLSPAPAADFARASRLFHSPARVRVGIDPSAVVDPSARLGLAVRIGPLAVVGENAVLGDRVEVHAHVTLYAGVQVGEDTTIHAGCVLREHTRVGMRCVLQPNVVLGGDGFGFARRADGAYEKIAQTGTVVVEDDVEIGAGTTIDRATFAETRIRRGTKIDNLVQVAHNCSVGEDTILCAQVGLAGSTRVGQRVTLAGQVGVAGHLEIGDGAIATAQTGIPSSVAAGHVVSGYPAMDNRSWLKSSAVFTRLPELHRLVRRLEARVEKLEGGTAVSGEP